jgi:hypothetical protein
MTMVGGGKIYHRRYRRLPSAICCPPLQLNSRIRHCRLSHGRLNRTPLSITATFKHHRPSLLLNGRHILMPPAAAICRCLDLIAVSFFAPPPSQRPSLPPSKDATAIKRPRLPPPSKSCFVFYCCHQTPPPARRPPSAVSPSPWSIAASIKRPSPCHRQPLPHSSNTVELVGAS